MINDHLKMTLETGTRITLRLEPNEKRRLEAEARIQGCTVSEVVRKRLRLGPPVKSQLRDETSMAGESLLTSCGGCGALTRRSEIVTIRACRMCQGKLASPSHGNSNPDRGNEAGTAPLTQS
jgi:hypothetical protein